MRLHHALRLKRKGGNRKRRGPLLLDDRGSIFVDSTSSYFQTAYCRLLLLKAQGSYCWTAEAPTSGRSLLPFSDAGERAAPTWKASSPEVGSSRNRTSGRPSSSQPMERRLRSPLKRNGGGGWGEVGVGIVRLAWGRADIEAQPSHHIQSTLSEMQPPFHIQPQP
eukprot:scaffold27292_cov86-Isochrysis_galbana.AAC.2